MNQNFGNLERLTLENTYYRKVFYTGNNMQIVLMNLPPNDFIPLEVHPHTEQFFRVESGKCNVMINGSDHILEDGHFIVVPAGTHHKVINVSNTKNLKLYTIYSPPEHPANRLDVVNPVGHRSNNIIRFV